ncbi:MAG: SUMF1/EgtB/PvdO family nonheme iron enzyme [Myxococcota bacterium]|nr:SUMF1/EgtB/PvdO family nonheme iron enzyme [Myxococcota bacterium]
MKRAAIDTVLVSLALSSNVHPPGVAALTAAHARQETMCNLSAKRSATPPEEPPPLCPATMVEVTGDWCPVVEQLCVRWVDPKHPERDRCAEYLPTGRCFGVPAHKHFCVDRYEWPNEPAVKPAVAVDWLHAREQCAGAGKRLCLDSEWTLACEGRERLPYPYGYVRDPEACNIDRPYILPDESKWNDPKTRLTEIIRLDQRDPSGARESCISPYGVSDMTGNVDEWVVNETGKDRERPYVSGLKGGYWGPVRDRCRPMTTDHNQWYTGYQIGFRCCADASNTRNTQARIAPPERPPTGLGS